MGGMLSDVGHQCHKGIVVDKIKTMMGCIDLNLMKNLSVAVPLDDFAFGRIVGHRIHHIVPNGLAVGRQPSLWPRWRIGILKEPDFFLAFPINDSDVTRPLD